MSRIRIKSIHVEGFRGVLKADLPINGMTLLAGKNSTGKSSLIQSLLILAQSQEERVRTNGSILMLGDAKGNINDNAPQESLLYKYEFEFAKSRYLSELDVRKKIDFKKSFTFEMRLKPNPVEFAGLSVEEMTLKQDDFIVMHCVNHSINSAAKRDVEDVDENRNANPLDILRVASVMGSKIRTTTIFLNGINPEFYHFKLREDVIKKNLKKILLERKASKRSHSRRRSSSLSEIAEFSTLRVEDWDRIDNFVIKKIYSEEFGDIKGMLSSQTMAAIIKYWEMTEGGTRESKEKVDIKRKREAITEIAVSLLKELKAESEFEMMSSPSTHPFRLSYLSIEEEVLAAEDLILASRLIGIVAEGINSFLAGIRYLGPLRAEPKAAYGSAYTTPNTPLGINGGSTAEYLHRSFIRNSNTASGSKKNRGRASLDAKAKKQLDYMVKTIGIGDHVEVEQVGRFGYSIKIKQHGVNRDLTEMGTGVSQVIPVLALLLSAPDGSLVILEQPELHLHPAIQSGLAQLLYEESRRVNIICETHSEYIVTRLRKIVLEGSLEEVKNRFSNAETSDGLPRTNVDFVWAEPHYGTAKKVIGYNLSPIVLDDHKDILKWPSGFFDDQTKDVDAIISAKISLNKIDSA